MIIDGKTIAANLRAVLSSKIAERALKPDVTKPGLAVYDLAVPGLAVVLVGNNPASEVYVRNKAKQTREIGMRSYEHHLAENVSENELLDLVKSLNNNNEIDGILVQLPLPAHINAQKIIEAIDPAKDVDGFHPMNVGRLSSGLPSLVPCTPQGSLMLIKSAKTNLAGLNAVILGRSNIVGKPMAQLLLGENCTVTIAHSKTSNVESLCQKADILIAAIGQPEIVRGSWIKPGAIVIDVGINRIIGKDNKPKLTGDVNFKEASEIATHITPVPGGVGPMTIACLLSNTLEAAIRRRGI